MKTMKQVLTEFHRIQKQLIIGGSVDLRVYKSGDFWTIDISRYTFTEDCKIATKDSVEWRHHSYYREEDEQENMAKLSEFKKKFNLK